MDVLCTPVFTPRSLQYGMAEIPRKPPAVATQVNGSAISSSRNSLRSVRKERGASFEGKFEFVCILLPEFE